MVNPFEFILTKFVAYPTLWVCLMPFAVVFRMFGWAEGAESITSALDALKNA